MSRDLILPRAPLFDAFDDLFDFDRHFYFFNRDEKDMHPYDVIRKKDALILTHNVCGMNKEDLKLAIKTENLKHYIVINGTSKDEITGKTYSINSRFSYDPEEVDVSKATSEMKNGLLYITIPYKAKEEVSDNEIQIEIK
jgi:HSP20 family molecular chaperone IbpA